LCKTLQVPPPHQLAPAAPPSRAGCACSPSIATSPSSSAASRMWSPGPFSVSLPSLPQWFTQGQGHRHADGSGGQTIFESISKVVSRAKRDESDFLPSPPSRAAPLADRPLGGPDGTFHVHFSFVRPPPPLAGGPGGPFIHIWGRWARGGGVGTPLLGPRRRQPIVPLRFPQQPQGVRLRCSCSPESGWCSKRFWHWTGPSHTQIRKYKHKSYENPKNSNNENFVNKCIEYIPTHLVWRGGFPRNMR